MGIDIRKDLKKMVRHLIRAKEDDLNEADTVRLISEVLENVLGYNVFTEITREQNIKRKYVDLAIKIDGKVRLIIEVKSAGSQLRERFIEQAQNYAAHGNIRWVILTNGLVWNLYHLTFGEGIEYELTFSVDIGAHPLKDVADILSLLHRRSILRGDLEKFWKKRSALTSKSIAKVVFHEDTLKFIRRIIRKQSGFFVDEEDLGKAIQEMFSVKTREEVGPFKIQRRRKARKSKEQRIELKPTNVRPSVSDMVSPDS